MPCDTWGSIDGWLIQLNLAELASEASVAQCRTSGPAGERRKA